MATVTTSMECKQCGFSQAISDFNTHTHEEFNLCPLCGWHEWWRAVTTLKDGERYFKLNKAGHFMHRHYERKGYGAYFYQVKEGIGVGGCFHANITREEILEFYEKLKADPEIVSEHCWATIVDQERKRIDVVFGDIREWYGFAEKPLAEAQAGFGSIQEEKNE